MTKLELLSAHLNNLRSTLFDVYTQIEDAINVCSDITDTAEYEVERSIATIAGRELNLFLQDAQTPIQLVDDLRMVVSWLDEAVKQRTEAV